MLTELKIWNFAFVPLSDEAASDDADTGTGDDDPDELKEGSDGAGTDDGEDDQADGGLSAE